MAEEVEGKVIVRRNADGTRDVSLLDPKTGREARRIRAADDAGARALADKVAEISKRGGNRTTYREV